MMDDVRQRDFVRFCRDVLEECVTHEKPEMLDSYTKMWKLYNRCKDSMDGRSSSRSTITRNTVFEIGILFFFLTQADRCLFRTHIADDQLLRGGAVQ